MNYLSTKKEEKVKMMGKMTSDRLGLFTLSKLKKPPQLQKTTLQLSRFFKFPKTRFFRNGFFVSAQHENLESCRVVFWG